MKICLKQKEEPTDLVLQEYFKLDNKIIVLEGPDASGKTTLYENLNKEFPGIYIHNGYYPGMDVVLHHKQSLEIAQDIKNHNLNSYIDRLWLSELIYSKVFRNNYTKYTYEIIEEMNKKIDWIIICQINPKEKYLEKFNSIKFSRQEMFDDMKNVYEEYKKFKTNEYKNKNTLLSILSKKINNKIIQYDYNENNIHEIEKRIFNI